MITRRQANAGILASAGAATLRLAAAQEAHAITCRCHAMTAASHC